jgi:uncharacterized protein YqhQ
MEITAVSSVIFLIVIAAIAFFVLRRVVKMAIRATIVALILLIAIVGGVSLWMFGSGVDKSSDNRSAPVRKVR